MKSLVLITTFTFILCFSNRIEAQSVKEIISNGNWLISKPIESLTLSDTLVIIQKPMNSFGKWIEFSGDSTLKQRQTYHYCRNSKRGVYTMMLGYRWYKKGTWNTFYENLEINLGNKTMDLMTRYKSLDTLKFIVSTTTSH